MSREKLIFLRFHRCTHFSVMLCFSKSKRKKDKREIFFKIMFHVEKIMFHAADGFIGEIPDRLNVEK